MTRAIDYIVQVRAGTSAYRLDVMPELARWKGRGRPPFPRYRAAPASLRELVLEAGAEQTLEVTSREGSRGPMRSRFVALRGRPANIALRRAAANRQTELPVCWLLAEWPAGAEEPSDYWLSCRPRLPHARPPAPETQGGSLSLFALLRELQTLIGLLERKLPDLQTTAAARLPTPRTTLT
jgi:hypothetical protein